MPCDAPQDATALRRYDRRYTPDTGENIKAAVEDAVGNWLPYIQLVNVFTSTPETNPNMILIQIEFIVTVDDPNAVNTITFTFNTAGE